MWPHDAHVSSRFGLSRVEHHMPHEVVRLCRAVDRVVGRATSALLAASFTIGLMGCDALSGPDEPRIGGHAPLFTARLMSDFDFAPDSRTIYYVAIDNAQYTTVGVRAVDVASGQVRTLAGGLPGRNGMSQRIRAPRNSADVFLAVTHDVGCTPSTLWRVPTAGGVPVTVATDIDAAAFAVSPDGKRFAFVAKPPIAPATLTCPGGDSLVVLRSDGATSPELRVIARNVASFEMSPLAVSDAGDAIFYRRTFAPTATQRLMIAPSDGGASRDLLTPTSGVSFIAPVVRWNGSNARVLEAAVTDNGSRYTISERDASTDTRTEVGAVADRAEFGPQLTWADNGSVWAMWMPVEDLTPNEIERKTHRYRLYLGGPGSTTRSILEMVADEAPWRLVLSPDGQRVAFGFRSSVYVIPI
jgi:hypothetical protein